MTTRARRTGWLNPRRPKAERRTPRPRFRKGQDPAFYELCAYCSCRPCSPWCERRQYVPPTLAQMRKAEADLLDTLRRGMVANDGKPLEWRGPTRETEGKRKKRWA